MASLDNVLESVSHLPTTRSVKALHRMLQFAVWQNEQLGAALKVNVSEEAYKAALEARPKRAAPGGDHLAEFREKQATVRTEMTAANGGTNPSRVELTAEVNRRRAAGEAPFTAEDAAAYAAKQSGAKPVRSAPKPAAAAPVKSAAKPASKSAVEAAPAPKSAVKPSSAVGKAKAAK